MILVLEFVILWNWEFVSIFCITMLRIYDWTWQLLSSRSMSTKLIRVYLNTIHWHQLNREDACHNNKYKISSLHYKNKWFCHWPHKIFYKLITKIEQPSDVKKNFIFVNYHDSFMTDVLKLNEFQCVSYMLWFWSEDRALLTIVIW
jgi:hypothetical protein